MKKFTLGCLTSFIFLGLLNSKCYAQDVSTAVVSNHAFYIGHQEDVPTDIAFNNDGTKMYIIGVNDTVYEYSLAVPFVTSTTVHTADSEDFYVGSQEDAAQGLTFNTDGTKMYIIGVQSNKVVQYSLGTAFDVSTATYDGSSKEFYVGGQEDSARSVEFNTDGTKMFILGFNDKSIVEYSLSTEFDVSSATYLGADQELDVSDQESTPLGMAFSHNGFKLYVIGFNDDNVVEYSLGTAFDVSTATHDGLSEELYVGTEEGKSRGIAFNNNGTKMFVIGDGTDTVHEYSLEADLYIPDANFKAALVEDDTINTNEDTEISYSEATAFTGTIDVNNLEITDLTGIEAFVNITGLLCYDNDITTLDLSNNTDLETLWCYSTAITNLDVSKNTDLKVLYCLFNEIDSLDLSNNTALTALSCGETNITSLDLSNNIALTSLFCNNNNGLITLDVSKNTALTTLNCSENTDLISLNVANTNNANFTSFNAKENPSLTCIEVDNVSDSTTNWAADVDNTDLFSTDCYVCYINIPDANFKAALVANTNINTNEDDEISCDEATEFTGIIDVQSKSITDLTGIENFVNITSLYCQANNDLKSIDISKNTALTSLSCFSTGITSLDVSNNTALLDLTCSSTNITSLDVSNNTNLKVLYCSSTKINSLDISNNTALTSLICGSTSITTLDISKHTALEILNFSKNDITSIDVSNNTALTQLKCTSSGITSLDVSKNIALETLYCSKTGLTNLDVSENIALKYLDCSETDLTNLDVSKNTILTTLYCYENDDLISLNVANTNNTNFTNFKVTENPSLICIQVDDVDYSTTNWVDGVDSTNLFNINCDTYYVSIPDANFKAALVAKTSINTNGDTEISYIEAATFTDALYVHKNSIADLTGIEAFVNITELNCYNNNLTSLDVSKNTSLIKLNIYNNSLKSLNVTGITTLDNINAFGNNLTSLDVSTNTALTSLVVSNSDIEDIDLTNNIYLTVLNLTYNDLDTLDLSKNTALTRLSLNGNNLTTLDLSKNTALTILALSGNNLTPLDLSKNTALKILSCNGTDITNLDLSKNTALTSLNCSDTDLTNLDVSNNTALTYLNYSETNITSLDVSNNTALTQLYCSSAASITSLDVSKNIALETLGCSYTGLTNLDLSKNTSLVNLDCNDTNLTSLDLSKNMALKTLHCNGSTGLKSIDLPENIALKTLYCWETGLTSLDVSKNTALTNLRCYENDDLTSLDLSKNIALETLYCYNTGLTSIDVSNNTALTDLACHKNNDLTSLNVANTNNENFTYFKATENPNLTCIQVDDVADSTIKWGSDVDNTDIFSTDCSLTLGVVDDEFNNAINVYPNPVTNVLNISLKSGTQLEKVQVYNLIGKQLLESTNQTIDVTSLPKGVYLLKVSNTKGDIAIRKIVKE